MKVLTIATLTLFSSLVFAQGNTTGPGNHARPQYSGPGLDYAGVPKPITCVDTTTGNVYRFRIAQNWMEFKLNGQKDFQSCLTRADHIENKVESLEDYKHIDFFSMSQKAPIDATEELVFECKDSVSGDVSKGGLLGIFNYTPLGSILTIVGGFPFSKEVFGYSALLSPLPSLNEIDNTSDSTIVCEGIDVSRINYPNIYYPRTLNP